MKDFKRRYSYAMSILLFLAISTGIQFSGCSIKKPQAPSWDTDWELPLINRTYGIQELVAKMHDSNIMFDSLGNPGIHVEQVLDTVRVDDDLKIDGMTIALRDSIGAIEIAPPPDINTTTLLSNIIDIGLGFVPPASFDFSQPMQSFTNFTWATIDSGTMSVTFVNNLEIDLDTLIITVIDNRDGHVVGMVNCDNGLNYLETESHSMDICNQTISSTLILSYHGHTPGGVLINDGPQSLEAAASFPGDLIISAGQAETPDIVRAKSETHSFEDSTKIYSSVISQGLISFNILNQTDFPFTITLHSANFILNGIEFQSSRELSPHDSSSFTVDLAGYNFIPIDGSPAQTVIVDMINQIEPSAPEQYTFRAQDSLNVNIDISDIQFGQITGRISPSTVDIGPVQDTIELPLGIDQATLNQAVMYLNIYNNSMMPLDLNLAIEGDDKTLPVAGRIEPKNSIDEPARLTTIIVGSDILAQFLNPAPRVVMMAGSIRVNPDYENATVTSNDVIYGDFLIASPLALLFPETTIVETNLTSTEMGRDARPRDFRETVLSGRLDGTLENCLPVGMRISFYFGTKGDSTIYSDVSTLKLGPYILPPATVDPDGRVISSTKSNIADVINIDGLAVFDNDRIYIGQKIEVLPTDSSGVTFRGDDYLKLHGTIKMKIRAGENLWGGN